MHILPMEFSRTLQQIKAYAQRNGLPLIPIKADSVSIITEPTSFYSTILDKIKLASRRLTLSALYIGSGPKEDVLIKTICDNLRHNKCLSVDILLDANRARRQNTDKRSSVLALDELLRYASVKLHLVKTIAGNSLIGRLFTDRFKIVEIFSTYHAKMLIFDDDVIVTGANLSDIYFDQRQDRYIVIRGSKSLSGYLQKLLGVIADEQGSLKVSINGCSKDYSEECKQNLDLVDSDCYIIPLVQHGPSALFEKEEFLRFLNSILPEDSQVYMASGYFNPSPTVGGLNVNSVLVPSETANGFHNGGGLLRYVPRLYSALHKAYLKNHPRCDYRVYNKPGWSFHAKGIWVEGLKDDLYIHQIGSSNFNCRSAQRDLEIQLVLLTTNRQLSEILKEERISLWKDSTRMYVSQFEGLNSIYSVMSKIVKSFL